MGVRELPLFFLVFLTPYLLALGVFLLIFSV